MDYDLISYCNNKWPCIGGVARYDMQLNLIFPKRKFFKGPEEKEKMINYLNKSHNPIIITDNHLSCDIPNKYPIIIVHHGCALTTSERNPDWDKNIRDLCCNGQKQMLSYRNPKNTWIISISKACTDDFTKYYPELYPRFKRIDLLHPSEMNEDIYKKKFNNKPVILGNWNHIKKGGHLIPSLKKMLPEFEFKHLFIKPNDNETPDSFNARKQQIYIQSDMFLQISNSEGLSYASQDAMINGLIPICSNVGGFYKDIDSDAFVELDWQKCYGDNTDLLYICEKIRYGWMNKEKISKNARNWYMRNCRFNDWSNKMKEIILNFAVHNYTNT